MFTIDLRPALRTAGTLWGDRMDGRIDLERARRDAKALLSAARAGDVVLRADRAPRLADAQHAVARSLGADSWPALVHRELIARVVAGEDVRVNPRVLGGALIEAARAGSADAVYRLLLAGAPADARDAASGGTALHVAAAAGRPDVVDVLVGWVPVDRRAVNREGETALDVARDPVVTRMLSPLPEAAWDPELGEAAWAAEAALFGLVASSPLASRREAGDGFAFRTGMLDNTRNGVVCSRCDDVEEVLAWLGAPAQWLVPAGAALELPGCTPERNGVFMAAPIGAGEALEEISPVTDADTLAAALRAGGEDDAGEAALLASLGFAGPLRHHAAWRDGEPVGLVSTFVSGDTLTLTALAVAPAHRRRGIGRSLVLHALRGGADLDVALLAPTPGTIPFYAALGFTLYRFPPDRTFYTPLT